MNSNRDTVSDKETNHHNTLSWLEECRLRFIWPCKSDCQPIFPKIQRTYSLFEKLWFVRPLDFSNVTFGTSFAFQMREVFLAAAPSPIQYHQFLPTNPITPIPSRSAISNLTQKNPAYGRHWISQPMWIVAPIPFILFCFVQTWQLNYWIGPVGLIKWKEIKEKKI